MTIEEANVLHPRCIRTHTGKFMNVFQPTPDMIDIEDIAHALAHIPRFGGHLHRFYSVAQHSLHCAEGADKGHELAALLHDASEAYLGDIPTPIKNHLYDYKRIEDGLMKVIAEKFGFEYPLSSEVKRVDKAMLNEEWDGIMIHRRPKLVYFIPGEAKLLFLSKYKELTKA